MQLSGAKNEQTLAHFPDKFWLVKIKIAILCIVYLLFYKSVISDFTEYNKKCPFMGQKCQLGQKIMQNTEQIV